LEQESRELSCLHRDTISRKSSKPAILAGGQFEEIPTKPSPLFLDAVRTIRFAAFRAK
jgi:hypothetical protein